MRFVLIFSLVLTLISGKLPDMVGVESKAPAASAVFLTDSNSPPTEFDTLLPQGSIGTTQPRYVKFTKVFVFESAQTHTRYSSHSPRAPPYSV